jgi:hyperosmotically inducible protein
MLTPLIVLIAAFSAPGLPQERDPRRERVETEIVHELLTLPFYGVFDNLAFVVERGGVVRLRGQVTRPTLKSDAEARVKKTPGVEQVINEIEVLPVSPEDDRIRLAVARAIYRSDALERYGFQTNPSIHIIVKAGRVTLEGAVDSEMDKTIAGMKAREVGGTFEVKNNLSVSK